MKKYLACFILTAIFTLAAFAQIKEPRLIDELGEANSENLMASLSNANIERNDNRGSTLQILIYRNEKKSFGASHRLAAKIKTYLTKDGAFETITTVCRPDKEKSVQIWLLPDEASRKTCESEQFNFQKTTLFDSAYYSNSELGTCCIIDEFDDEEIAGTLHAFAEELKKSPESQAYIFVYLGTNIFWRGYSNERPKPVRKLDSPNLFQEMSKSAVKILTENGIDASRIILKNSGYKDNTRSLELWLVPKNGEIPKPSPDYFPKKKRSGKR